MQIRFVRDGQPPRQHRRRSLRGAHAGAAFISCHSRHALPPRAMLSPACCRWATHGIAGTTAACRRRAALPWTHPLISCFTAAPQRPRDICLLRLFRSQLPSRAAPAAMRRGAMPLAPPGCAECESNSCSFIADQASVTPFCFCRLQHGQAPLKNQHTRGIILWRRCVLQTGCRRHASTRAWRLHAC